VATLSEEQLRDIADAYSCEQIIDLLDIDSITLLDFFREYVEENLDKFNLRPVDCNDF
jgi:hypothetical protein|tara:strand:+ start:1446 stop:1619 length:174 start_codon:yes stop_codon:yes gene_type:complete